MARVFISHSSGDSVEALALKTWLERAEPGIPAGVRWNEALRRANDRCEAVICLVSRHWDGSQECRAEYLAAKDRGKPIFLVRLEPTAGRDITSEWQRCDVFGDGPKTVIEVDGATESVEIRCQGTRVLGRGHAATVHFLCPREQA